MRLYVIAICSLWVSFAHVATCASAQETDDDLAEVCLQFYEYSGTKLVFDRKNLPAAKYHDVLSPLKDQRRLQAARLVLEEVKKYPPGYLGHAGLKAVGVFAACVSKTGDGFRSYDPGVKGYKYFGVYNGKNAVAAAFYSESQLPLTFHHEVFHHIDSTVLGVTERWQLSSDDAPYYAVLTGEDAYAPPAISKQDLQQLKKRCIGWKLRDAVSEYAAKNPREDQAETARHLMEALPDSLVQIVEHPEWLGSQRIIHILSQYQQATLDGPNVDWFVDVALERAPNSVDSARKRLEEFAVRGRTGYEGVSRDPAGARRALKAVTRLRRLASAEQTSEMVTLATLVTEALVRQRFRPDVSQTRFALWGCEDEAGVNWTLRRDLELIAENAARLKRIAKLDQSQSDAVARAQLRNLRLVARFYVYVDTRWSITPGTDAAFDRLKDAIAFALPGDRENLAMSLSESSLKELAWRINRAGMPFMVP